MFCFVLCKLPYCTYSVRIPSAVSLPSGVSQDTRTVSLFGSAMRSFTLGHLIRGDSRSENKTRAFSSSWRNTLPIWVQHPAFWRLCSLLFISLSALILPHLSWWVLKGIWAFTDAWLILPSAGLTRCPMGAMYYLHQLYPHASDGMAIKLPVNQKLLLSDSDFQQL